MRIQFIETDINHSGATHLNSLKEIFDACVSEYGSEKLDWLHAQTIDYSCDVFIRPVSSSEVKIGFVCDASDTVNTSNTIHWVNITVLDAAMLDALTQALLITIGMGSMQSVTGSFSVDWADVRAVLSHGSIAYCIPLDWHAAQRPSEQLHGLMHELRQSVEITACAMLLNQGLRINDTYQKVQSLTTAIGIPEDCLNITNITNSRLIPQTNLLMLVCKYL
jgi:hypothetical protein